MLLYFRIPIRWTELFRRTIKKAVKDNCIDLAAALAYYFFLALFPALLFIISFLAYLPLAGAWDPMLQRLGQLAPPPVVTVLRQQIDSLAGYHSLLTIGILGTLWSTSSALTAIIRTLNAAFGLTETRPWWKVRLYALALTLGLILFAFLAFALILIGPQLAQWLDRPLHLGSAGVGVLLVLYWAMAVLFAILMVDLVLYFGPDAESKWVWITPGSLAGTVLFICASLGFKAYIINFGKYNATYGFIGSVIILLLWFYFFGLSLVIGAEMDAVIDQLLHRIHKPLKPGQRPKIGAAGDDNAP